MLITPLLLALEMEGMLVLVLLLDIQRAGIFLYCFSFCLPCAGYKLDLYATGFAVHRVIFTSLAPGYDVLVPSRVC